MTEKRLEGLIPLIKYFSEMMGPATEIILYNVDTMSVAYVENPFDEEIFVGSEMRALERKFLEEKVYEKEDYIINYRALSRHKDKLKSATFFLKNGSNNPHAIITINQKVEHLLILRDMINELISGKNPYDESEGKSFYDSFDVSVTDIVTKTMEEEISKFNLPVDRLTSQEKIEITQKLDRLGIFLVRGAISELAELLQTTETTIYRYLEKVNEDK